MAPFYGWDSAASKLEPLRGGSLLFIDLGSMKGLEPPNGFKHETPGLGMQRLNHYDCLLRLFTMIVHYDWERLFTIVAFKMELFVTEVKDCKLLLLLLFHLICGKGPRSASEKHRQIALETASPFSSVWVSLILSYCIMF